MPLLVAGPEPGAGASTPNHPLEQRSVQVGPTCSARFLRPRGVCVWPKEVTLAPRPRSILFQLCCVTIVSFYMVMLLLFAFTSLHGVLRPNVAVMGP